MYVMICTLLISASYVAKKLTMISLHLYKIHTVLASAVELQESISDVMRYVNFYELIDYSDHIICVISSFCGQDIFIIL